MVHVAPFLQCPHGESLATTHMVHINIELDVCLKAQFSLKARQFGISLKGICTNNAVGGHHQRDSHLPLIKSSVHSPDGRKQGAGEGSSGLSRMALQRRDEGARPGGHDEGHHPHVGVLLHQRLGAPRLFGGILSSPHLLQIP